MTLYIIISFGLTILWLVYRDWKNKKLITQLLDAGVDHEKRLQTAIFDIKRLKGQALSTYNDLRQYDKLIKDFNLLLTTLGLEYVAEQEVPENGYDNIPAKYETKEEGLLWGIIDKLIDCEHEIAGLKVNQTGLLNWQRAFSMRLII